MPTGVSVGRDAHGAFKTAALKEYPPLLCKAMAQSFCDVSAQFMPSPACPAEGFWSNMVMPFDVYWEMGQDFWG